MLSKLFYRPSKILAVIFVSSSLLGCQASTPPSETLVTATVTACQPSPIQTTDTGFSEIQGDMLADGELWALLFFGKAYANQEVKIVWRITGTAEPPFTVEGKHEDGTTIVPVWGPQSHEDSNWERPGEEWGTSFNFPKPGCWTLTATRGTTSGEIRLDVLAP